MTTQSTPGSQNSTFRAAVVTAPGEPDAIEYVDVPVVALAPARSASRWPPPP